MNTKPEAELTKLMQHNCSCDCIHINTNNRKVEVTK